jgi:membrane-bound inhibitor of C-type lysozyme
MRKELGLGLAIAVAVAAAGWAVRSAQAQTYYHYTCRNGATFELALFPDRRAAFLQLDGKSLRLPRFISVTGTRYRKSGVTLWIKGERATLRRAGKRTECKRQ